MNPSTQQDSRDAQCPRKDSSLRQKARSRTIPLPSTHIARTQSELQLSEDMAAAEWKDMCMFYRVVGGIRERQEQCCSNGVAIHEEPKRHHSTREQTPIRDWTGKDVSATVDTTARVTPFETPSRDATPPSQGRLPPYPQSLLLRTPRLNSDGGWSITGFEDDAQSPETNPLALIEQDSFDDGAVFVMDL